MRNNRLKLFFITLCVTAFAFANNVAAGLQDQPNNVFKDPEGRYELTLPPKWQAVSYQDGAGNARIDIIYRDRAFGLLKITQEMPRANEDLEAVIRAEIDQNLRFRPGYVYNSIERFAGIHTRGQLLQFDFTSGGTPKKARNYYLKNNDVSVWVLRFVGNREVLAPLRHETDAIARSFKPLK